ncbi:uncharacterized protein METZ01_LOCUS179096 [marine metagenome]|uniref:Uncharacterized protein n=1 Tax=marine metagenome TaxID=408172 RepID=A0A382CKB8_9ZZZZ
MVIEEHGEIVEDNVSGNEAEDLTEDIEGEVTTEDLEVEGIGEFEIPEGDNLSLYLGFKAYHENSDYPEAVNSFQAAIEYQSSLIVEEEIPEDPEEINDGYDLNTDIIAKSAYWMGESYVKLGQIDQAIESFKKIIEDCRMHYLSSAAERRIDQLK